MAWHLVAAAVLLHALCGCAAEPLVPASSCPVTLVQVTANGEKDGVATEGLHLEESGRRYLEGLPSPLFLVPMLGVYRGGKSLLLNRLGGKSAPYQGGFGVGHGQGTFTRGIQVCAEVVEGLGTVVWMDTEGLFSSEEAHSAYGPKVFSLALLFSSTVLLNSVKVLNDQFFAFFGEQQQFARVLRQGLADEGLPQDGMLPGNLSVFWILQQPINFDKTGSTTSTQLEAFLDVKGDETRAWVRRDFRHLMHEVPVASYDYNAWKHLDTTPDSELVGDYIDSANHLRKRVFSELANARPLQVDAAAKQLEMFVELVQTERFSGALAKETFELSEISSLCNSFKQKVAELAGPLPSTKLAEAFAEANRSMDERRLEVIEKFHLGADWTRKLEACLQDRAVEVNRENAELLLVQWQKTAGKAAEEGSCFFLGKLAHELKDYGTTYGPAFGADAQARALEYASALQRTRLVECVRLKHFLWPLLPWFAAPLGGFYLQKGIMSGLMNLCVHVVALAGIYVLMQFFGRLPGQQFLPRPGGARSFCLTMGVEPKANRPRVMPQMPQMPQVEGYEVYIRRYRFCDFAEAAVYWASRMGLLAPGKALHCCVRFAKRGCAVNQEDWAEAADRLSASADSDPLTVSHKSADSTVMNLAGRLEEKADTRASEDPFQKGAMTVRTPPRRRPIVETIASPGRSCESEGAAAYNRKLAHLTMPDPSHRHEAGASHVSQTSPPGDSLAAAFQQRHFGRTADPPQPVSPALSENCPSSTWNTEKVEVHSPVSKAEKFDAAFENSVARTRRSLGEPLRPVERENDDLRDVFVPQTQRLARTPPHAARYSDELENEDAETSSLFKTHPIVPQSAAPFQSADRQQSQRFRPFGSEGVDEASPAHGRGFTWKPPPQAASSETDEATWRRHLEGRGCVYAFPCSEIHYGQCDPYETKTGPPVIEVTAAFDIDHAFTFANECQVPHWAVALRREVSQPGVSGASPDGTGQ